MTSDISFGGEGDSLFSPYVLEDENGNQHNYRLLDFYKEGDKLYYALIPDSGDPTELLGIPQLAVLTVQPDAYGVDCLMPIEDDDEFERIQMIFLQRLADELEYEDDDEDDDDSDENSG